MAEQVPRTLPSRFLGIVERGGNVRPHPGGAGHADGTAVRFLIGWTIVLVIWILAGLPVDPGAGLYLQP